MVLQYSCIWPEKPQNSSMIANSVEMNHVIRQAK